MTGVWAGLVEDCHDCHLSRNGYHVLPAGSSSGFLPLEGAPKVMKFFIMAQSLSLCLIGYEWFG
jgi:hypothetical protein